MRLSQYFLPTLKEDPGEAQIASHRLMLRAGLIQQVASGLYAWLPLGFRVLRNIQDIIRREQEHAGAVEVLMPTLQPAELWQESGRYDAYGKEMLRIRDRHDREMLYGPTNEEMITAIFRTHVRSYKDLPKNLWHMQWKFRDEVRPRFGVMRGREFLMKDGYSFDLTFDGARQAYQKMYLAYLRTFAALGLKAIPMRADSGAIGGDMSHEFIVLAATGESAVFCDRQWVEQDALANAPTTDADLDPFFQRLSGIYAATDEKHDPAALAPEALVSARGIEVGHIFYFGTKYSLPMQALITNPAGERVPAEMGSYGIGVSRLVGAIIEACHDDNGIVWPEAVAPFKVALLNLKKGDPATDAASEQAYAMLTRAGVPVLYDDRDERAGTKFADADLIGLPWQLIISPRGLAGGTVELKHRATGARQELSLESALVRLTPLA